MGLTNDTGQNGNAGQAGTGAGSGTWTPDESWTNPTWRIYAATQGWQDLFANGKPSGFKLQSDGSCYRFQRLTPNGLPASFEPTSGLTPAGTTAMNLVEFKTLPAFDQNSLPAADSQLVRQYWDAHRRFFSNAQLPRFKRLEGTASFRREAHKVHLYQIGNVFDDEKRSLLVIRFVSVTGDSNPDGWAVGHN